MHLFKHFKMDLHGKEVSQLNVANRISCSWIMIFNRLYTKTKFLLIPNYTSVRQKSCLEPCYECVMISLRCNSHWHFHFVMVYGFNQINIHSFINRFIDMISFTQWNALIQKLDKSVKVTATDGFKLPAVDVFGMALKFLKDHLIEAVSNALQTYVASIIHI